jgi:NAD(P)-dependent dehydrogenase (short-subunit alcohol dehydrogenase family)
LEVTVVAAGKFPGKIAIVTGGGRGIGEAYSKGLAAEGATVVVADLDVEGAERVAKEIIAEGGQASASRVDVSDPESAAAMADEVAAAHGGIDFLVNNAAIYGGMQIAPLLSVDLAYLRRFFDVNMFGALMCARACVPHMTGREGAAIVNQSSTAAWMAGGFYSVAKAGLNSLTVSLATELGWQGIRVNAIAPGPTDTQATRDVVPEGLIQPLLQQLAIQRLGQPEDLVGALVFLLSPEASWVTGHVLAVDGGQVKRL